MAWFGEDVKKKVYHASRRGLVKGLEFIKQESVKVVPKDTGALEKSAGIIYNTQGGNKGNHRGAITYNKSYAVRQHEELDYRHAEGRIAKYLELPFQQNQLKALEIMAREINKGTK